MARSLICLKMIKRQNAAVSRRWSYYRTRSAVNVLRLPQHTLEHLQNRHYCTTKKKFCSPAVLRLFTVCVDWFKTTSLLHLKKPAHRR